MSYRLNPFTGQLEHVRGLQTNVEFAEKISVIFDCDVSAAIGDVVRPSTTTADKVEVVTTNIWPNLAIGVIITKPTTTTCEVLISGKLEGITFGLSGLTFGKAIFVGTSGGVTTTVPATGHLQKMGLAIKSDAIFLLPSLEKVVRP